MNWPVLKDVKTMSGFAAAFLLGIITIVLAVNGSDTWVFFIVVSLILTFLSANRAEKIYRNHS